MTKTFNLLLATACSVLCLFSCTEEELVSPATEASPIDDQATCAPYGWDTTDFEALAHYYAGYDEAVEYYAYNGEVIWKRSSPDYIQYSYNCSTNDKDKRLYFSVPELANRYNRSKLRLLANSGAGWGCFGTPAATFHVAGYGHAVYPAGMPYVRVVIGQYCRTDVELVLVR